MSPVTPPEKFRTGVQLDKVVGRPTVTVLPEPEVNTPLDPRIEIALDDAVAVPALVGILETAVVDTVTVLPDAAVEIGAVPAIVIAPPDGNAAPVFPRSSSKEPVPAPSSTHVAVIPPEVAENEVRVKVLLVDLFIHLLPGANIPLSSLTSEEVGSLVKMIGINWMVEVFPCPCE